MKNNSKLIETFNVVQNKSENVYLIDPIILFSIIIIVCLLIYIIGFRLSNIINK